MNSSFSGFAYLAGYIVLVGVASFLQKFTMKELSPYQVNFLMAIGMAVTAIPALLIAQGSLAVPMKSLPLGAPIGLFMALGSIAYVLAISKLPVGLAAAISTSYVVLVALLSRVFLGESLSWLKILGIVLTIVGVALLSFEQKH
ncbi:MAG TPA: DMT family transporter [Chthoniobacterales bacterium]|nr:DMT family transporter [Chthoniobacterales bacterium]